MVYLAIHSSSRYCFQGVWTKDLREIGPSPTGQRAYKDKTHKIPKNL